MDDFKFSFSMIARLRWAVLCGVLLSAAGCSALAAPLDPSEKIQVFSGLVVHVSDGDSIWVRPSAEERTRKLRIAAIDAPEICQEGGVDSRDALRRHIEGQTVTVRQHGIDVFGRPLVEVQLGSEDVAVWMVKQGWAWSYRHRKSAGRFSQEEAKARKQGRGVFSNQWAEEPRLFRRRHGPCKRI